MIDKKEKKGKKENNRKQVSSEWNTSKRRPKPSQIANWSTVLAKW